jgi:ferrous iron transport protein B
VAHEHGGRSTAAPETTALVALVGAPNAGKTSVFNALTGLNSKTGNYPGVTVSRSTGIFHAGGQAFAVEDLPGTYSLEPISPDEQIVANTLSGVGTRRPDALIVVLDATTLRRSLTFVAQVLRLGLPTSIVLSMTDELARRQGNVDVDRLALALGVPVSSVIANRRVGIPELRDSVANWQDWAQPALSPPEDAAECRSWASSVLDACYYRSAVTDRRTDRIDRVLLHPVWGTVVFMAVMIAFFQIIFGLSAPLQGAVVDACTWAGSVVRDLIPIPWLAGLLADGVIGGVGTVLAFVPQILLMFLMLSLLEGVGYLSRAAFLMDRVMAKAGLEGRAFVALLSSVACAVPGIMATRTLPSSKDRIATMMAAPLMTCSARLPVYILLISMLVSPEARFGPLQAQGAIMFALYLLGAISAMLAAWVVSSIQGRRGNLLPFYMEMPPYRMPTARSVLLSTWGSAKTFLKKCGTIILSASIVLWVLLNLTLPGAVAADAAASPASAETSTAQTMNSSVAAAIGRGMEPAFAPLGFDWRIDIGILASLTARETFVATMGQIASAENPDDPAAALKSMTYTDGEHAGQPVFTAPTIAALLVFFMFALQCMSTIAVMRRESGSWKWPAIAFGYMFGLAWSGAWVAHALVALAVGSA